MPKIHEVVDRARADHLRKQQSSEAASPVERIEGIFPNLDQNQDAGPSGECAKHSDALSTVCWCSTFGGWKLLIPVGPVTSSAPGNTRWRSSHRGWAGYVSGLMLILDAAKAGAGIGTRLASALPALRIGSTSGLDPIPYTLQPTASGRNTTHLSAVKLETLMKLRSRRSVPVLCFVIPKPYAPELCTLGTVDIEPEAPAASSGTLIPVPNVHLESQPIIA